MANLYVGQKTIAQILKISDRRVRQLEKEGILVKDETEGLYYIPDCVQLYYEYKLKPSNNVDYDNEKALHEKAKRERIEMKNSQLRNELHAAEDIKLVLTNMIVMFRSKMLSIPAKVSPKIVRQRNVNLINFELEKVIKEALTELSEYNPDMFNMNGDVGNAIKDN